MLKKITAILCAVMIPVSVVFADMESDLADPNITNAQALANEIVALQAANPTLSAEDAKDQATAALVNALVASGMAASSAATAAINAGGSETIANNTAGTSAGVGGVGGVAGGSAAAGGGGGGGGGGYSS